MQYRSLLAIDLRIDLFRLGFSWANTFRRWLIGLCRNHKLWPRAHPKGLKPGTEIKYWLANRTSGPGSSRDWGSGRAPVLDHLSVVFRGLSSSDFTVVICHLTARIRSEKCILKQCHPRANFIERTYINLYGIAYNTPRLYDVAYCSVGKEKFSLWPSGFMAETAM